MLEEVSTVLETVFHFAEIGVQDVRECVAKRFTVLNQKIEEDIKLMK